MCLWICQYCCCCKAGEPDDPKSKKKKKKTSKKGKTKDSKGSAADLPVGQQKTISEISEQELLEKYVIQLPKDNCKNANQWLKTRGYQLTGETLGSGGYGTVVKGIKYESDGTSIDIAVKTIDLDPQNKKYKKLLDGLKNELFITDALIREINKIRHNHIIKIYDRFIIENSEELVDGQPSEKTTKAYILMELADGDLDNQIEKTGPLEDGLAKRYFTQIVYAIEYMHTLNIAHRDIKLQNILLVKSKTIPFQKDIKVSDFGLSRVQYKEETGVIYSVKTGGTLMYKSPEILRLQTRVTKKVYDAFRADIWALGVCLYRMLTGDYPFPPNISPEKLLKRQQNKEIRFNFPENPEIIITKYAKELLERLLEPNPDKRLKTYSLRGQMWIKNEISMTVSGTQTN